MPREVVRRGDEPGFSVIHKWSLLLFRRHFARPVKRKIFILLAAAVIALALVFTLQRDPSVEFGTFQPQLRDTFRRSGYTTVTEASCSPQRVPLPLAIQWHPRRWHHESSVQMAIGFPNGAEYYTVTQDGSAMLDCFVRYLDGRASFIDIRASGAQHLAATALRSTLAQQFPGLPIKLTTQ